MTDERAAYRILSIYGFFGPDDNLYEEGETIYFDGEPNEEMEPLNQAGKIKMTEYLDRLDKLAEETAKKNGRHFQGRPRNSEGALILARQDEEFKLRIRGAEKDLSTVGIEVMTPAQIPEVGTANPKKGPGRPRYKNVEIVSH